MNQSDERGAAVLAVFVLLLWVWAIAYFHGKELTEIRERIRAIEQRTGGTKP